MKTKEIQNMSALELGKAIREKQTSSVEVTKHIFEQIKKKEKNFNCYINICEKEALERAEIVQAGIEAGELNGQLAGVPMGVKDNICTQGYVTTCGSKMLNNFIPFYSSFAYNRLEKEGAVMVGKLNMDEYAMGSTTETSYYGSTKNPWNPDFVPGGSSGGSAAAVAAGEAFYALGSDTGGSIRQPCSFCGVSGIKPTYGKVSRYGLVAYASSLDQIGPIGKDILDCAAILNVISGKDEKDQTSVASEDIDLDEANCSGVRGLRIGIPHEYLGKGLDEDVREKVLDAARIFRDAGAQVEEFDFPIVEYAVPTYYIIACAEACSNLARFDGLKYGFHAEGIDGISDVYLESRSQGFGLEVKRRIMLGNFVLSSGYYDAYYNKALQAKSIVIKAFAEAFSKYDLILGPVAPTTALRAGENMDDPLKLYLGDIYTGLVNIAGLPGASIPCGFDRKNLPVGLQLIAAHHREQIIVNAACAFQKITDFHTKKPAAED